MKRILFAALTAAALFSGGILQSLNAQNMEIPKKVSPFPVGDKLPEQFSKYFVPFKSTDFLWKRNLIQQVLDQTKWTEKTTHQPSQDRTYKNQKSDYVVGKFKVPASNHGL